MRDRELYTPVDLAKRLNQTVPKIIPILDLLTRYGFTIRLSRHEQLFVKGARAPSPRTVAKIFHAILEDSQIAPYQWDRRNCVLTLSATEVGSLRSPIYGQGLTNGPDLD